MPKKINKFFLADLADNSDLKKTAESVKTARYFIF